MRGERGNRWTEQDSARQRDRLRDIDIWEDGGIDKKKRQARMNIVDG